MSASLVTPFEPQTFPAGTGKAKKIDATRWIEQHPWRGFLALTMLYFVAFLTLSSMKLLWLDEMITLHIARLGSVAAIWHALSLGADPNPPMIHLLVHACRWIFGEREFALRLPAAVGYWVGMVSLFLYLRRRVPATWALGGTVLSMTMAAFDYSYESRSYAVFYGLAILAFFCWSSSAEAERSPAVRGLFVVSMGLALAAGISTNYFAVLAFFPVAAGEAALTINRLAAISRRRRAGPNNGYVGAIAWRVWIAMGLAATPLIAFRPMIAYSIAQFAPYAWNKVSIDQVFDSYTQMVEIVLYPILALLLCAIMIRLLAPLSEDCRRKLRPGWLGGLAERAANVRSTLPRHEAVGILFLMAYPFLGYAVASFRGGMLSPRFVIPVCFGFAIAGTFASYRLFGHLPRAGFVLLCFWAAWFVARESVTGYWYEEQKQCFYKVIAHLPEAEADAPANSPIVIPEPLLALTFQHYAPPAYGARVVFPVDFPAIRLLRRDDSPEENFWAGRNLIYTLPILPLATFQHTAGQYLILASDGNWLVEDLRRHHYTVDRLPINTRAGAIGGFTPLARGVPVFFVSSGDAAVGARTFDPVPVPFRVEANLPNADLKAAEVPDPKGARR